MALDGGTTLATQKAKPLMFGKWLRSKMPNQASLRKNKLLAIFGERLLDAHYWHHNRQSSAIAMAAGLFAAWLPLPLHSFLAIGIALALRGYLPLAMAMVWVSNPLTIAPMMYGAYTLGSRMLGLEMADVKNLLEHDVWALGPPLVTGALTLALLSAIVGWLLTHLFWRCKIKRAWLKRKQR